MLNNTKSCKESGLSKREDGACSKPPEVTKGGKIQTIARNGFSPDDRGWCFVDDGTE
jgi:hypothetical protein